MIRYVYDKENKYLDDLYYHLRAHNVSFTRKKDKKLVYVSIMEKDEVLGVLKASSSWDWVGISECYYQDLSVLKQLIMATQLYFEKDDITGIKLYTESKNRYNDFLSIGFVEGEVIDTYIRPWYYANLYSKIDVLSEYQITYTTDENSGLGSFLKSKTRDFHQRERIDKNCEEMLFVALDGNRFVGGVSIEVYSHSIYTHLLAVDKQYRGKQIGKKLMVFPEKIAKEKNFKQLEVGTAEFQARPFYEKLGYKVVYTRNDNPKGFKTYTLVKILEE